MKQLIDCSGSHVILGLSDRAFVFVSSPCTLEKYTVVELLPRSSSHVSEEGELKLKEPQSKQAEEPKQTPSNQNSKLDDGKKEKECLLVPSKEQNGNDSLEGEEKSHSEKDVDSKNHGRKQSINSTQAVCCSFKKKNDHNNLLCAVSRMDKTLSVYLLNVSSILSVDNRQHQTLDPVRVHDAPKRCCGMLLTSGYGSSETEDVNILIAADLTGDVWAYPATAPLARARLLLGHTASMLTAIRLTNCVLASGNDRRLLTADRDEKIRVSAFPRTYDVKGYLLGHSSFVSCMDVCADSSVHRCVSGSGDGTIRMWDYVKCIQLCVHSVTGSKGEDGLTEDCEDTSNNKVDTMEESNDPYTLSATTHTQDGAVTSQIKSTRFPCAISINRIGTYVAAALHGCNEIFVYHVFLKSENNQYELQMERCIRCPAQPLSLHFQTHDDLLLVLTAHNQKYLCHYIKDTNVLSPVVNKENKCFPTNIDMPTTVMEQEGNSGRLTVMKKNEQFGFLVCKNENDASGNGDATNDQSMIRTNWNDVKKKEKDKLRMSRRKKRRALA